MMSLKKMSLREESYGENINYELIFSFIEELPKCKTCGGIKKVPYAVSFTINTKETADLLLHSLREIESKIEEKLYAQKQNSCKGR